MQSFTDFLNKLQMDVCMYSTYLRSVVLLAEEAVAATHLQLKVLS